MNEPDFGTAKAAKRGRNPRWPYVPVIDYGPQTGVHATRTEQIKGRAYDNRADAVACAQRVINARAALHETKLATPRLRALREQHGFPRELVGAQVTTRQGPRIFGTVVEPSAIERTEGTAALNVDIYGIRECVLVAWTHGGRRWHRPEELRLVKEGE
ncbi:hypothetical protein [Actinomadura violacea]|uniref:Uncharacterized protein n=1 Tax=Actinomadura violacea TaxID=2819934 RepID=A0ABS3RXZ3_9ACTN|nr:hypothetical protein [Actinomadura violacea]MBO2461626.1 hypothetical protein [Actinomadura violacea]